MFLRLDIYTIYGMMATTSIQNDALYIGKRTFKNCLKGEKKKKVLLWKKRKFFFLLPLSRVILLHETLVSHFGSCVRVFVVFFVIFYYKMSKLCFDSFYFTFTIAEHVCGIRSHIYLQKNFHEIYSFYSVFTLFFA